MYHKDIDEITHELYRRYESTSDKVIILPATNSLYACIVYKNEELIDAVVCLYEQDKGWEIIDGEKAQETSCLFVAFFASVIELYEEKMDLDDFDASKLLGGIG